MQLRDGSGITQEPSFLAPTDKNNCCNRPYSDESSLLRHQVFAQIHSQLYLKIYPTIQINSRYKKLY